jgi:hypothetical protein
LGRPVHAIEANRCYADACRNATREHGLRSIYALHCAAVDFAGGSAQLRLGASIGGCTSDFRDANAMIEAATDSEASFRFMRQMAIDIADRTVAKHWSIIEAVAQELSIVGRLERDQINAIVRQIPGGHALLGEPEPEPDPEPQVRYRYALFTSAPRPEFGDEATAQRSIAADSAPVRYRYGYLMPA